jgi:hypothetical protein
MVFIRVAASSVVIAAASSVVVGHAALDAAIAC